jgi:hypothetical protein
VPSLWPAGRRWARSLRRLRDADPHGRGRFPRAAVPHDGRRPRAPRRWHLGGLDHRPEPFTRVDARPGRRHLGQPWCERIDADPIRQRRERRSARGQCPAPARVDEQSARGLARDAQARAQGKVGRYRCPFGDTPPDVGGRHVRRLRRRLPQCLARRGPAPGIGWPALCPGPIGRRERPQPPAGRHERLCRSGQADGLGNGRAPVGPVGRVQAGGISRDGIARSADAKPSAKLRTQPGRQPLRLPPASPAGGQPPGP